MTQCNSLETMQNVNSVYLKMENDFNPTSLPSNVRILKVDCETFKSHECLKQLEELTIFCKSVEGDFKHLTNLKCFGLNAVIFPDYDDSWIYHNDSWIHHKLTQEMLPVGLTRLKLFSIMNFYPAIFDRITELKLTNNVELASLAAFPNLRTIHMPESTNAYLKVTEGLEFKHDCIEEAWLSTFSWPVTKFKIELSTVKHLKVSIHKNQDESVQYLIDHAPLLESIRLQIIETGHRINVGKNIKLYLDSYRCDEIDITVNGEKIPLPTNREKIYYNGEIEDVELPPI